MSNESIGLRALQNLRLVALYRSFSAAAEHAGISASALSRQVQSVEDNLGLKLFDRTTRKVSLTEAGAIFLRETEAIPSIMSGAIRRVREECLGMLKEIQVGISTELASAHIPGIFHAHKRFDSKSRLVISQADEGELLEQTQANRLDVAIMTMPSAIPQSIEVIHEMEDHFCILSGRDDGLGELPSTARDWKIWSANQNWLLPSVGTHSRRLMDTWMGEAGWKVVPSMELKDFDLMIQLVALGMGSTIVPRRAHGGFMRKRQVLKLPMPRTLSRTLVAIVPRFSRAPGHVNAFVKGILFS
ncbi:LysR family transcriptional regulator [Haloferula sp.]|uniref:LysR family transcriptional regulator n=1 Tax=Haloferula sp. TaxID=2497595 RepID=UPI003C7824A2